MARYIEYLKEDPVRIAFSVVHLKQDGGIRESFRFPFSPVSNFHQSIRTPCDSDPGVTGWYMSMLSHPLSLLIWALNPALSFHSHGAWCIVGKSHFPGSTVRSAPPPPQIKISVLNRL